MTMIAVTLSPAASFGHSSLEHSPLIRHSNFIIRTSADFLSFTGFSPMTDKPQGATISPSRTFRFGASSCGLA